MSNFSLMTVKHASLYYVTYAKVCVMHVCVYYNVATYVHCFIWQGKMTLCYCQGMIINQLMMIQINQLCAAPCAYCYLAI